MVDEHVEPFSKENRPPTYQNGVIVTPLPQDTGELPASIPAGYPSDINSKGTQDLQPPRTYQRSVLLPYYRRLVWTRESVF